MKQIKKTVAVQTFAILCGLFLHFIPALGVEVEKADKEKVISSYGWKKIK